MEIKVHDIVKFTGIEKLENYSTLPAWVFESSEAANYAVVRRMATSKEKTPIGLRGKTREQRVGAFIHSQDILQIMTPESLINQIDEYKGRVYYSSLKRIREEFSELPLSWGPTGSVGFEIASSHPVTTINSDIDIAIYPEKIDHDLLVEVSDFVESLGARVDAQVEIPRIGAFLLNDYVKNSTSGFIVRTPFGPQLCTIQEGQLRLMVNS